MAPSCGAILPPIINQLKVQPCGGMPAQRLDSGIVKWKNVACQFKKKTKNLDFLCTEMIKLNVQIVFSLRDLGSISSRPHNRRQHAAVPAWDLYIRFFTCMNVRDSPPGQLMWLRNRRISPQTVRGCLRSAHLSAGRPHRALELTEGYYPESANAYSYRYLTFQTDL